MTKTLTKNNLLNIQDKKWDYFIVGKIFNVFNSKPYHKRNLTELNNDSEAIPYITRTNKNNGVENVVKKEIWFQTNSKNTIMFGAENATFFISLLIILLEIKYIKLKIRILTNI